LIEVENLEECKEGRRKREFEVSFPLYQVLGQGGKRENRAP